MTVRQPIYVWQHRYNGKVIGEIRRVIVDGKKKDLPFYNGEKSCAPPQPWPLLGLDSYHDTISPVIIVEGQKKQQALASLGLQAIACLQGGNAAHCSDWTPLKGAKKIYIWPDNDETGQIFAQAVWAIVRTYGAQLAVIKVKGQKRKDDACDWLKRLPELEDWNELDPLTNHPEREAIYTHLWDAINSGLDEVPGHWRAPEEWPEPEKLAQPIRPVQRLKPEMIPDQLRSWTTDIAHRMQCPLEYVAIGALVMVAAAIGARVSIRPKRVDNWQEYANLWGLVCGPPGTLKTPALKEDISPLVRMDDVLFAEYQEEHKKFEAQKAKYDAESKAYKDSMGKGGKYGPRAEDQPPEKPEEPACKRFIANDSTVEAMAKLFADNPDGLLLFQDELSHLLSKWDKADNASDRPFYLESWSGSGRKTVDRIGRGTLRCENMCLSIFGGMQPDTVRTHLVSSSDSVNDGLLQRFQMAVYLTAEECEEQDMVDVFPDYAARNNVFRLVKDLVDSDYTLFGAQREDGSRSPFFRFSEDAQDVFFEWYKEHQKQIKAETNPIVAQHLSKYRKLMPSLSLIFHCLDVIGSRTIAQVSKKNAELAIIWCGFLEEHARRIYDMTGPREIRAAHDLSKHLKKLPTPFAVRHIQQHNWRHLNQRENIDAALKSLEEHNWIRRVQHTKSSGGGPPKIEYHINPKLELND